MKTTLENRHIPVAQCAENKIAAMPGRGGTGKVRNFPIGQQDINLDGVNKATEAGAKDDDHSRRSLDSVT
jgi:hypothetical protein